MTASGAVSCMCVGVSFMCLGDATRTFGWRREVRRGQASSASSRPLQAVILGGKIKIITKIDTNERLYPMQMRWPLTHWAVHIV